MALVKYGFCFVFLLSLVGALSGCGSVQTREPTSSLQTQGLELLTTDQKAQFTKALNAMQASDSAKARSILTKLIEQQNRVAELHLNLAIVEYRQQNYDAASKSLDQVLKLSPKSPQAYNLQALLAIKKGEFKEAEASLSKALDIKADYSRALYNMALLQDVYLQDIPRAVQFYQRYMEQAPDDTATKDWLMQLQGSLDNAL